MKALCSSHAVAFSAILALLGILTTLVLIWPASTTVPPKLESPHSPIPNHPLPGFGLDLGPSRIAASIRHINGTFENFILQALSDEYQDLFRDTSLGEPRCGYRWPSAMTDQSPSASSLYPDPANHTAIAILARVINMAKSRVQKASGLPIERIFISNPKFPGLCNDDIEAALRKANFAVIRNSRIIGQPNRLGASYASYGRGLCSDYTRRNPCEYEERYELPVREVMVVTYSNEALFVEHTFLQYAAEHTSQTESLIDWQAGADALRTVQDPGAHWDRVRVRVLERPVHWKEHVDVVMLAGEHGRNETFAAVVKDALARFQSEPPEFLMENGEASGARGAAEFAFRSQYQH